MKRDNLADGASSLLPAMPTGDTQSNTPTDPVEVQVREPWRFRIIATLFLGFTLLIILRLMVYQLFPAGESIWNRTIPEERAPRGSVVDRNGELLAFDRFFTELSADPSALKDDEIGLIATELERIAGISRVETMQRLTEFPEARYALLARDLDQNIGHAILNRRERDGRGNQQISDDHNDIDDAMSKINVRFRPKRFYPQYELACHILGMVGVDLSDEVRQRGYYGTEGYYNSFLWQKGVGLPGRSFLQIDDLSAEQRRFLPSVSGRDLVLTVDRTVQWIAEEELALALTTYDAESGTIIVLEPKTGAVLAMANAPGYDPNNYGDADPESFSNPAVSAQYEPGSIFKIITMAGALDAGVLEPTTVYTDTGRITIGQRVFFNSNRSAVGLTTAADALARSLNVVTVQIARDLVRNSSTNTCGASGLVNRPRSISPAKYLAP